MYVAFARTVTSIDVCVQLTTLARLLSKPVLEYMQRHRLLGALFSSCLVRIPNGLVVLPQGWRRPRTARTPRRRPRR